MGKPVRRFFYIGQSSGFRFLPHGFHVDVVQGVQQVDLTPLFLTVPLFVFAVSGSNSGTYNGIRYVLDGYRTSEQAYSIGGCHTGRDTGFGLSLIHI